MSDNYDIKTKGVTFNLLDPDQEKLFEHAMKRKNFSGYVKRLIQRDLEGLFVSHAPQVVQKEEVFEIDEELLEGLI